ncbi:MAG: biopolymer transporter ExbD [Bacteroidia bacterium]|nr:biopolymer transporter ExbD [Bacteroidia bacterium]MCC7533170.1 biopolymer transporter ExbD [Bacteroidia bacterium]MCZ2140385.1 biopolymer transporter ExbD [Bacteroidia bacterium]
MKIRRSKRFEAEVSTHSLNDIMFFLLLFFLIVSTVANPNVIKILLPKSQSNQSINKQPITLTVTEDKKYYINQQEMPFDALEPALIKESGNLPELTVVLRLPYNLQIQDLVDVMQIGARNKFRMVLATDKN